MSWQLNIFDGDSGYSAGSDPKSISPVIMGCIFSIIGLIMVFASFPVRTSTYAFIENSVPTTGEVTYVESRWVRDSDGDSRREYRSTVEYEYKGSVRSTIFNSEYYEGEILDLLVDSTAPSDVRIDSDYGVWGTYYILLGLGSVFLFGGGGFAYYTNLQRQEVLDVIESGRKVQAEITGIEHEVKTERGKGKYSRRYYEVHSWGIKCAWKNPLTGQVEELVSHMGSDELSSEIVGGIVTVSILPDDTSTYYVHLDSIKAPSQPSSPHLAT